MNCPHCQQELSEDHRETLCPNCGCDLAVMCKSPVAEVSGSNKGTYWLIFWLAFLGAPISVLTAASILRGQGILFLPILGAIIAGFSLAKIYTKTPAAFIGAGIVFTIGVLAIYVGIIFVGCLVVMGSGGF